MCFQFLLSVFQVNDASFVQWNLRRPKKECAASSLILGWGAPRESKSDRGATKTTDIWIWNVQPRHQLFSVWSDGLKKRRQMIFFIMDCINVIRFLLWYVCLILLLHFYYGFVFTQSSKPVMYHFAFFRWIVLQMICESVGFGGNEPCSQVTWPPKSLPLSAKKTSICLPFITSVDLPPLFNLQYKKVQLYSLLVRRSVCRGFILLSIRKYLESTTCIHSIIRCFLSSTLGHVRFDLNPYGLSVIERV